MNEKGAAYEEIRNPAGENVLILILTLEDIATHCCISGNSSSVQKGSNKIISCYCNMSSNFELSLKSLKLINKFIGNKLNN